MSDKKKGFYAELSAGKRKVIYLQPYYFQGGRWFKLKPGVIGERNAKTKKKS